MNTNNTCKYEKTILPPNTLYVRVGKRLLDASLSLIAIVALSPLLLIVSGLEVILHGTPILFVSERPGYNGNYFKMLKFRSMSNKCDSDGVPLPDNERLTKFGVFIRKTSIDELPALFSILKGDMSIIGPRPLLVEYMPMYGDRYIQRHNVKPGLELALLKKKVTNDDTLPGTWREQFENDIYYVENCSFLLDVKMLIAVILEVFSASARRANNSRVPFDGTNFDETRSKEELGISSSFSSINTSVKK